MILWSILSEAFQALCRRLQAIVPDVRLSAGHSHNDVFPFRTMLRTRKRLKM